MCTENCECRACLDSSNKWEADRRLGTLKVASRACTSGTWTMASLAASCSRNVRAPLDYSAFPLQMVR
jgi:hypothetical protein